MIGKRILSSVLVLGLMLILITSLAGAQGQAPQAQMGTAFTYQGRLAGAGGPVDGACDFQFTLYNARTDGAQVGAVEEAPDVAVNEGLFTVQLNFGQNAFKGDARWLEIAVRCPAGTGGYVALSPRQALTPAPYAVYAASAPDTLADLSCATGQLAKWNGSAWVCDDDDAGGGNGGDGYWALEGNGGTAPGTSFLGTTDNNALELKVNGQRALRLEPNATSPNVVGGYSGNQATSGKKGATIGGGGKSGRPNRALANFATVGGGSDNTAGSTDATVGGGLSNTAGADSATVAGGFGNEVTALLGTIGGGGRTTFSNAATGNRVTDRYGTVGGGGDNHAGDASGEDYTAYFATVGGGKGNSAGNEYATVAGGTNNEAMGSKAFIGGGTGNEANGSRATIAGGGSNWTSGSSYEAAIGGGFENRVFGTDATVPGGYQNTAIGNFSFAAGRHATAANQGCFAWGDANSGEVRCEVDNRWVARTSGGVYFYTNAALSSGVRVNGGGNAWSSASARELKQNYEVVDTVALVEQLAAEVPVMTWNYRSEDPSIRHMGPVAQDLYAAFGLGEDERHISTIDADGVALAAIQGLYQLVQEKDQRLGQQEALIAAQQEQIAGQSVQLQELATRQAELEALVTALARKVEGGGP